MTPPTPGSDSRMTAHEIEKRVSHEILEIVEELADDGDDGVVTTDAVVEAFFDDPAENARHGDPVGGTLTDLEAYGYVRREARDDGEDVWTDANPAAFRRDYVDTDETWPPNRSET